jgi:hypothetical protein
MTQEQFIYWVRGFIAGKDYISAQDTLILKEQAEKAGVVTFSSPTITPLRLREPYGKGQYEPYVKGPSDYPTPIVTS